MNERDSGNNSGLRDVLTGLISRLDSGNASTLGNLTNFSQVATSAITTVSQAASSAAQTTQNSTIGKDVLSALNPIGGMSATNILTSLFLGPLWRGVFSLFRHGADEPAPVLTKFPFPEDTRTDVSAGLRINGENSVASHDALGLSRRAPTSPTSINVSINALDARSILDRSDDIAAALKQAMLSNHEINDNLSELELCNFQR